MNISNRVRRLSSRYRTRQQLRCLPEHLLKDIGKTRQDITKELNKNTLPSLISLCLRHVRKGA
ncbi:hypothetical protein CXF72_13630 [Psychromonas sp. MB-3u-54]|uniref:DUF1127 domain-containing protein n=1 Tax=Psychromonas sp. MB-3u-54 TaxID=2058319 RepID=UPI000C33E265|nr:hypothetical protein CXF72_13630 [Psychromonas sp. MB-3u-54]